MQSEKVWSRFEAKRKDGTTIKLRIQDTPADRLEDVVEFNQEYLWKLESMYKAAGVLKNPDAVKEGLAVANGMFRQDKNHSVVCCLDDSPKVGKILGLSAMGLSHKDDTFSLDDLQVKTEEIKKFFELITFVKEKYDVMKELNFDKLFAGRGLSVHPDYEGLGIGTELLKTRSQICKEFGVPVTSASMTAVGSQRAAEKAGWQTGCQVPVSDIEEQLGCKFEGAPEFLKTMFVKVDL